MEHSETAQEPTNTGTEDFGASMTDDEMEAFVDSTLGIKATPVTDDGAKDDGVKPEDKPVEPAKPADDKPANKPEDKKDEEKDGKTPDAEKLVEAAPQPEEAKPVDIPAVDLSDLFVEIEAFLLDDEGNPQPETIKLLVGEALPDNIRFKNEKQLFDLLEAQQEMKQIRDERNTEYEEKTAEAAKQTSAQTAQEDQLAGWDAEIAELIEGGDLVAPKVKPGEIGFLEDPSTKIVDAVFKFMKTENDQRIADKKKPITSFEVAFNKYNKSAAAKEVKVAEDREAELTKARGSMVGGGGAGGAASGTTTKMYTAGSARNIYQIDTSDL